MTTHISDFTLTDEDETDVWVEFEFTPGAPAQTYGPPEHCDPGYGPEIELIKVWRKADGPKAGANLITLSEADAQRIYDWIAENFETDTDADPDREREDRNERHDQ